MWFISWLSFGTFIVCVVHTLPGHKFTLFADDTNFNIYMV